jgi:hypothetical protein
VKTVLIFIGAAVAIVVAALWFKSHKVPTYQVTADQVPRVLAELSAASARPAFAVFTVTTPGQPPQEDGLSIQFSMDGAKPGFDWLLDGPQNTRDQDRFVDFARAAGYDPVLKEKNGVRYLRVENGDLARLCRDVITKMYQRPESNPVTLLVEGFDWKP